MSRVVESTLASLEEFQEHDMRMSIVADIKFNGEREQAQSSARRMSYQTLEKLC